MRKLKTEELGRADITSFKEQEKLPIVVVLDNVRSMHNIGSVFRTADGFAISALLLCGITAQPPHREIEKTALGATNSVSWLFYEHTADALTALRGQGYTLIAIEQVEGSTMLDEFTPEPGKKYALIFGNEVDGVSEAAMQMVDASVEIPQFGTKHSFNIVISAGIVLWDMFSKIKKQS